MSGRQYEVCKKHPNYLKCQIGSVNWCFLSISFVNFVSKTIIVGPDEQGIIWET